VCGRSVADASSVQRVGKDGRVAMADQPGRTEVSIGAFGRDAALRSDLPAPLDREDAFGHDDYSKASAAVLLDAQAPFTLGIFGDWGLGKTTIVESIGVRVVSAGAGYVKFDAWRYEDDALRREFLREVAAQLSGQGLLPGYNATEDLRDLVVDLPKREERLRPTGREVAAALIPALLMGVIVFVAIRFSVLGHLIGSAQAPNSQSSWAALLVTLALFVYGLMSKIIQVRETVVTVRRVEEPERFSAKFRSLLSRVEARRVVIAVDNLDRCTPELVERVLATIKTYLEPASINPKGAEAVFVIAVDDEALRRHLLARELLVDGGSRSIDEGNARDAHLEAARQVDEYFRKFFNAVVRLRQLLPDDSTRYTSAQLKPFFERRRQQSRMNESTADALDARLVEMVASALRRNPRRIKQFVSSLDVRLRLIDAREESRRIDPPVSDDVLGIAKLALIEEEWGDRYRQLERDPLRLNAWQQDVTTGEVSPTDFAAFLRQTRDVVPRNVAAVVNLKLERDDLELPGFSTYRDAVSTGEREEAKKIVEKAPDELRYEYALRLPDLLVRELRERRFSRAREVLDVALQEPPLGLPDEGLRRRVIEEAVQESQLVTLFPGLAPAPVFEALDLLDLEERRRGRRPFLNLSALGQSAGPESVRAVAQELALRVGELDQHERGEVMNALNVDPWATQFRDALLSLPESDPTLITESTMSSLQQSVLGQATGLELPASGVRLLVLGFGAGLGEGMHDQFIERLVAYLPQVLASPDDVRLRGPAFTDALQSLPAIARNRLEDLSAVLEREAVTLTERNSLTSDAAGFVVDVANEIARLGDGMSPLEEWRRTLARLRDRKDLIEDDLVDRPRVLRPDVIEQLSVPTDRSE
jgi:hypothetical protein